MRAHITLAALLMAATVACQRPQPSAAPPGASEREVDRVLAIALAPPVIHAEPGFAATVLVPPGELYDPLTMIPHDGVVWVNDDGGTGRNGRIWAIDKQGHVSAAVSADRLLPTIGFDFAPAGFGAYAGKILMLSQQEFYAAGARKGHLIQAIDPDGSGPGQTVCALPLAGTVNGGVPGAGLEARFGPPGSPFAGKFFSVTILNNTVYQTAADGTCTPFVTFDRQVWGIGFLPDGSRMLATLKGGGAMMSGLPPGADANRGAIVAVKPDGTIDPTPILDTPHRPTDVEVAPAGFGAYGGQIFFTDWDTDSSAPLDTPMKPESGLYRITPDGQAHLVASGFLRPAGIAFVDGSIWISNINRDRVDLPEGSIVRIDLK